MKQTITIIDKKTGKSTTKTVNVSNREILNAQQSHKSQVFVDRKRRMKNGYSKYKRDYE